MPEANINELIDVLVWNYIHQKDKLLQRAGVVRKFDRESLASLIRPKMEKMAHTVKDWDVDPDVIMEAAFAWADHNRHPDGPMHNMFHSVKYLSKALSYYLNVPYEAVMEKRCLATYLKSMDDQHTRFRENLSPGADLTMQTAIPVEHRYLIAIDRLDLISAAQMSTPLLEVMASDRKVRRWLNHRGVQYQVVADQFNKIKDNI